MEAIVSRKVGEMDFVLFLSFLQIRKSMIFTSHSEIFVYDLPLQKHSMTEEKFC